MVMGDDGTESPAASPARSDAGGVALGVLTPSGPSCRECCISTLLFSNT